MNIPRRRKPEPLGVREAPQIRCPAHLAWIRGHECAVSGNRGHICEGKIEAAHVRTGTDGGMSVKPSDTWSIPLCGDAHRWQHQIGEKAFETYYGISMRKIAEALAAKSPHKHKLTLEAGGQSNKRAR